MRARLIAPPLSEQEAARVVRFEMAPDAPESYDPALWEALSELIPCNLFAGCGEECECAEGEVRFALLRLITAERVHAVDCEGDACCQATVRRARLVAKAADVQPVVTR